MTTTHDNSAKPFMGINMYLDNGTLTTRYALDHLIQDDEKMMWAVCLSLDSWMREVCPEWKAAQEVIEADARKYAYAEVFPPFPL